MQRPKLLTLLIAMISCPSLLHATELSQPPVNYFSGLDQFTSRPPSSPQVPVFKEQPVSRRLPRHEQAELLDWVSAANNICGGYYREPEIILKYPSPPDLATTDTVINARLPSIFSAKGRSILQGDVTVTQPGREITADKAILYRDPQTDKITAIDLFGNVHLREAGKLMVAEHIHLDLTQHTAYLENALYRFSKAVSTKVLNAWGTLKEGTRDAAGILHLNTATYSTCPPTTRTWAVTADDLKLDKAQGVGTAKNSWLQVEKIPVFYFPYFTFPLDDRRKSGFLFPTYGYSDPSGAIISIPYYLNLAPNYDATITPALYSKRGIQQNVSVRYLTSIDQGAFNFSILPGDSVFAQFKKDAPAEYAAIPDENVYLSRLDKFNNSRSYISYLDNAIFDPHWSSSINLNYVSDDYYFQDFGVTPGAVATDQLLNETDLKYQGDNWNFLTRLQGYETLHPINESLIEDQYARLPEVDLNADYPEQAYGFDYQVKNQFVYFDRARDFITGNPIVTGERYHFDPSISWPMANMSGYFIPQLQMDTTAYALKDQLPTWSRDITRVLPMFDIDSGLFFDRNTHFLTKTYRQTLEPRLFYLWVPNEQQNEIPLFDTTLPTFSFEQMFQTNRFTGIDRIGDANQITAALTSRLLDADDGEEKVSASIGSIFLFQQHQVNCSLLSNCLPDPTHNENISPIVSELSYNLNTAWNMTADLAWDPNTTQTNNGSFNLTYHYNQRLFNIAYYFVRNADIQNQVLPAGQTTILSTTPNNVNRINLGMALPLTQHWSFLGDWNYNIGTRNSQLYYYGAQYDSCCWAMRVLASRTLTAVDQLGRTQYDPGVYVQFQLKGLGNFGNNNPSGLLNSTLPGYQDQFQSGLRPL